MKLAFGADEAVGRWVMDRIPHAPPTGVGPFTAIGVMDGDRPIAGVVYHGYIPAFRSIEITMAADSPRWAQRGTIRALLRYPFEQLGCWRVAVAIPHINTRAIKFVKGLGFKQEGVLRRAFGKEHAVVLSLLRPEFDRLFAKETPHGQEIGRVATRAA